MCILSPDVPRVPEGKDDTCGKEHIGTQGGSQPCLAGESQNKVIQQGVHRKDRAPHAGHEHIDVEKDRVVVMRRVHHLAGILQGERDAGQDRAERNGGEPCVDQDPAPGEERGQGKSDSDNQEAPEQEKARFSGRQNRQQP